jgi:O-antigen ligase
MIEMNIPLLWLCPFIKENGKLMRVVALLTGIMLIFVLVLTGSRGGMIGLIIGGFICLLFKVYIDRLNVKKIIILCSIFFVFVSGIWGLFSVYSANNRGAIRSYDHERILLWESSYHMWQDHKLLGVGLRHWHDEYVNEYISPEAKEPNLEFPHNLYMYFLSETGILGGIGIFLFTVGIFIYLISLLRINCKNMFFLAFIWSFLTIMIHSQVDAGITNKFVMRLYSTYLGISLASIAYYRVNKLEKQV